MMLCCYEEGSSFVVVGFVVENGEGTVELLGEDEADHLVREGHWGKGELLVGSGIDLGREAVGASDEEDKATCEGVLLALYPLGKLDAAEGLAVLVEEDKVVSRLELLEDELAFGLFLQVGGEGLGVSELGNDGYVEGGVVLEAGGIVVDESLYVGVGCAAYEEKEELHGDGEWGAMNPSAELKGTVVEEFLLSELRS